ncbi:MAG: hypothetical protein MSS82_05700 [Bacteroidales bacterium]|nr:hypothetical protein [Bacteroidales bacterium]
MDILRKELNAIYEAQHLNPATLDRQAVAGAQRLLADWVRVSNACMVLTDASADSACLFTGHLGQLLGLTLSAFGQTARVAAGKVSFPEYRNKVAILSK